MEDFFPEFDEEIQDPSDLLLPVLAVEGQAPRDQNGTIRPESLDYLLQVRLGIQDPDELDIWRELVQCVADERSRATQVRLEDRSGSKATK